jgi:hypothetical protein
LFVPPRKAVAFLTPFSARRKHCARRVSPSADGDKGCSPLTSSAFSEEKAAQKNFYNRVRSHERYPPSLVGGSVDKNRLVNEAVGGVDDPTARWSSTLKRALPTLPRGRVSRQNALVNEAVGGVDDPTARWLPTLPRGRVSLQNAFVDEAVGGVDDPTARWHPPSWEGQSTKIALSTKRWVG